MLSRTTDRILGAVCLLALLGAGTAFVAHGAPGSRAGQARLFVSHAWRLCADFQPWSDPLAAIVVVWVAVGATGLLWSRRRGETRRAQGQIWVAVLAILLILLAIWFSAAAGEGGRWGTRDRGVRRPAGGAQGSR